MRRSLLALSLALVAHLILTACATIGPPQPPSLDLPKPPSDLRAVRKGDRVILTWTVPILTTDRQTIRSLGPTQICRGSAELKDCGMPAAQTTTPIPPSVQTNKKKVAASYTDTLPVTLESDAPGTSIVYAIEVLNRDGRSAGLSNRARVPLVHTLSPPPDFRAQVERQGVVLTWTNHLPANPQQSLRYFYRVYRRQEGAQQPSIAGEVPGGSDPQITFTDSGFEWEKTYQYSVETITAISEPGKPEMQVEGDDSPEVRVFADDVFPPAVPSGLQAVFSGPGQQPFIDLVWAPVPDIDLAGYNIYRREEGSAALKLSSELVKAPAYRDMNVLPGQRYIYSVSAVDVRGNESAKSEEASESVP